MKQTKIKYDNLVDRLKSGDSVSFGQIEEFFAKGFLSKFLGRVEENSKQEKFEKLYKENLSEDEFEDYPELPKEMFSEQYLETIRMVSGALGVRPNVENMSSFINQALRKKDWKILDKVLSLTEEGKLKSGTIEKIALETLVIEKDDYSYKELKKHFGELNFTSELVEPVYNQNLSERNLKTLERVKKETKIPIPEKICQISYETYLSEGDPKSITNLKRISGITPKKTKKIRKNFKRLVEGGHLSPEEINESDELFDIYSDKKLIKDLQLGLLRNGMIDTFNGLYKNIELKLNKNELRKIYTEFDRKNNLQEIISVAEKTTIAPTGKILKKVYDSLLTGRYFEKILKFSEKTKTKPVFSKETLNHELEDSVKSTNLWAFNNIGEIMKSIDIAIPEDSIHKISLNYLNSSRENDITTIDAIYKKHKLKPSSEVTSTKVSRLNSFLGKTISNKELDLETPLAPTRGYNLKDYNRFKSEVNDLVNNYAMEIAKIKKENPEIKITDSESFQEVYEKVLELMFLQNLRKEKKLVSLEKLVQNTGVAISEGAVKNAVINHVENITGSGEKYSSKDIQDIFNKVSERLPEFKINSKLKKEIIYGLINYFPEGCNLSEGLDYLNFMISGLDLSNNDKEDIRNKAVSEIITQDDISEYNSLVKFLDKKPDFSETESKQIRSLALHKVRKSNLNGFDEVVSSTGIKIKATPEEAKSVYEKYFKLQDNNKPSEIALRIGMKVSADLVEKKYEAMIKELRISKNPFKSKLYTQDIRDDLEKLASLEELKQDTNINLDGSKVKETLNLVFNPVPTSERCYDIESIKKFYKGFTSIFDYTPDNKVIQDFYKIANKNNNFYLMNFLLDEYKIAPEIGVVKDLFQREATTSSSDFLKQRDSFMQKLVDNTQKYFTKDQESHFKDMLNNYTGGKK